MTSFDSKYYNALLECALRYEYLIDHCYLYDRPQKIKDLEDFISLFRSGIIDELPLQKLNRWLGYIQGVLITFDLTTVEAERDFTRPLFRPLDFGDV